jgi:antitoxin ParD1/3/4/toxin ParE1/3/4
MPPYVITPRARASLDAIQEHLTLESDHAWPNLRANLDAAFATIAEMPGLGFVRSRWTAREFRFFVVKPYIIVYDGSRRPLRIIDVVHSAMDLGRVMRKRKRP